MAQTIEQQTGWKRTFPKMICQDPVVLESISDYSYDLDNPEFVKYFISRTGIVINHTKQSLSNLAIEINKHIDFIRSSEKFTYITGKMIPFSEREFYVKVHKILRGQIQDCWELYNGTTRSN